jgi:hypothetical protein
MFYALASLSPKTQAAQAMSALNGAMVMVRRPQSCQLRHKILCAVYSECPHRSIDSPNLSIDDQAIADCERQMLRFQNQLKLLS